LILLPLFLLLLQAEEGDNEARRIAGEDKSYVE